MRVELWVISPIVCHQPCVTTQETGTNKNTETCNYSALQVGTGIALLMGQMANTKET